MKKLIVLLTLVVCCDDDTAQIGIKQTHQKDSSVNIVTLDKGSPDQGLDLSFLQADASSSKDSEVDQEVDAVVPICDITTTDDPEQYCFCFPECCSRQRWYCPPSPAREVESIDLVLEICDENKQPCDFDEDEGCPPPEIIFRTPCSVTSECPPGSELGSVTWFNCEPEEGMPGRQKVMCSKGALIHGPCEPCVEELCNNKDDDCDSKIDEGIFECETACGEGTGVCIDGAIERCDVREPAEEVCDFEDNDCDGNIDEGQRNACDQCGATPQEECNDEDDDCDGLLDEALERECQSDCERGTETCNQGSWNSCTARQPTDEECDGLDNDCDGSSDEGLECLCTIDQVGVLLPCAEPPLRCGGGFKTCECLDVDCLQLAMGECKSLCAQIEDPVSDDCDPSLGIIIQEELCNNFDEDCDDLIDEGVERSCYTGPPETLNVGICAPGTQTCVDGQWGGNDGNTWVANVCEGETTPQEEVCNGADDDCDGEVDYGEEIADTDILLVIDTSGSMDEEIRAVLIALNRFAQHFSAQNSIHWGMIAGPFVGEDPATGFRKEILRIVSDISPLQDFLDRFQALDPEDFDGGEEMLMDAVYIALRNLNPNGVNLANSIWVDGAFSEPPLEQFIINWRQNTDRIIIVFSDEDEQTYLRPPVGNQTLLDAINGAPNTRLYTFALPFYGWDELAVDAGGEAFGLTNNSAQMYNDLMSIIDAACLPREGGEQGAMMFRRQYIYASYHIELTCY